ncbi:hypothetical protein DFH29DRAFT_1082893, partial [Suillus ampliporus]
MVMKLAVRMRPMLGLTQSSRYVISASLSQYYTSSLYQGCVARPRDIFPPRLVSRQQASNRGLAKYGDDFWGTDTNRTPCGALPLSGPLPLLRWRNLFGFLHFTRPANTPQPIPLEPRHWNFRFFPLRISKQPVDSVVTPCRLEDRYGIAPESDAEAATMSTVQCHKVQRIRKGLMGNQRKHKAQLVGRGKIPTK